MIWTLKSATSRSRLRQTFKKLVEKSKLTQQQADEALARLTVVNQIEALSEADLVIEAVVEKKKLNSLYLSNSLRFVVRKPFLQAIHLQFRWLQFRRALLTLSA